MNLQNVILQYNTKSSIIGLQVKVNFKKPTLSRWNLYDGAKIHFNTFATTVKLEKHLLWSMPFFYVICRIYCTYIKHIYG